MSKSVQMKEIEKHFTALRADVMIGTSDEAERKKKLTAIDEQEKQVKQGFSATIEDLKALQREARDYANILSVSSEEAIGLLTIRELRHIHFHIDEMCK